MKRLSSVLALSAAALALAGPGAFSSDNFGPKLDPFAGSGSGGKSRRRATRGAKNPQQKAAKLAFLRDSSAQANVLAKDRADARTYRRWFDSLSPADQAFARQHALHRPMPESGFRRPSTDEDALDHAEHEPIPEADRRGSHNGRPVIAQSHEVIDHLEPITPEDLAHLTPDAVASAVDDFGHALRWALDCSATRSELPQRTDAKNQEPRTKNQELHHLVEFGRRSIVLICTMAPDLAPGLPLSPDLARAFLTSFHDFRISETLQRLQETGQVYRRILAWLKSATDLASAGERLQIVAYELRPDLIDAATLASLGAPTNKTRQALNKVANCLRDTFAGIKSFTMRADATRLRCQSAQLATA
jgi:hypothetical protein